MSSTAIQNSESSRAAFVRALAVGVLALAAPVLLGQEGPGVSGAPPLPNRTYLEATYNDQTYVIELVHELINDPDTSTVFNYPGNVAVTGQRQFYVDTGDRTVHVLDEAGSHIVNIGQEGQGPGEFQVPWLVAVAPQDSIYIYDRGRRSVEVFDASYNFRRSSRLPFTISATSMHLFEPDVLLFSGATLVEAGFGHGIHLFAIDGPDAQHIRSFAETPDIDPAFYSKFAIGVASIDLDGGILYNQMGPYSVRKYSRDGQLLWRIDDPDLVPPPLTTARPDAGGRLQIGRYAYSAAVLPIGGGFYLHMIKVPPADESLPPPVLYDRIFELIEVKESEPIRRVQFQVEDPLLYTARDAQGRLYGLWHEWDFKIIRSTISVKKRGGGA